MANIQAPGIEEIAGSVPFQKDAIIQKEYGRFLEDFVDGDLYVHPRAFTISHSFAQEYATTFHEAAPLFLSAPYAKAHGFNDMLVSPLLVFNIALSLGVQNNSEKAMANLGYYDVTFLKPVYPGDTLRSRTKVLSKKARGGDKPGIVHVRTICTNQNGQPVLQYERKIMVPPRGDRPASSSNIASTPDATFPEQSKPVIELPELPTLNRDVIEHTGRNTYFEDFAAGQIYVHRNMRTISDEHMPWTYRVGNTHPLHYDRLYSKAQSGPMSGEPIVYGGLVFGWLAGLASRDTAENMLWDLGYTEGYHTQPAFAGDTVGSISRILKTEDGPIPGTGIIHIQLIGVKNMLTMEAVQKFGEDLFIKENNKKDLGKEKIPEKIFEIERKLLIKKRP
jgi:2-methylfumaryl-CoA hydratase